MLWMSGSELQLRDSDEKLKKAAGSLGNAPDSQNEGSDVDKRET